MSEPLERYGDVSLAEALSRLAHEIRESRKVSEAQLVWFQQQADEENLNKKLEELRGSLEGAITRAKDEIMATQAELATDLRAVLEKQKKTGAEIATLQGSVDGLNQKIAVLEQVVANGEANPELVQAVADVKNQAQIVDDLIPEVVTPPAEGRPR